MQCVCEVIEWGGELFCQFFMKFILLMCELYVKYDWMVKKFCVVVCWVNNRMWRLVVFWFEDYD